MANREALLADTFLRLADTLVDDFDVIEVLSTLSARCVELLDAAASGVLIVDPQGALQVMAASSEAVNVLELFQVQNQEGPCLDAFRTARPVVGADLTVDGRWPRFSAMAVDAGFRAVHAFPMVVRANVLGTLNLFMNRTGVLAPPDADVSRALAHAATLTLMQSRATEDSQRQTSQLQGALNSRVTIEQAKGVLSEVAGVGTDEAFARLRSFARHHNIKLTDVAVGVVGRTLSSADQDELMAPHASDAPD